MKNLIYVLTLLFLVQISFAQGELAGFSKVDKRIYPKALKSFLKDFIFISPGNIKLHQIETPKLGERDSLIIAYYPPVKEVHLNAFYIAQTELSNVEYRQFYEAMLKKIGAAAAAQYYPDTSCWLREFPYANMDAMAQYYFLHPAYDNYPVVGVSKKQAQSYCEWKTEELQALMVEKGVNAVHLGTVRLPSEAEWELVADAEKLYTPWASYPWGESIMMPIPKKKKEREAVYNSVYRANFGPIYDQNGDMFKDFSDDGGLYTQVVGSYLPNFYELYNLAANVSEWVADDLTFEDQGASTNPINKFVSSEDFFLTVTELLNGDEAELDLYLTEFIQKQYDDPKNLDNLLAALKRDLKLFYKNGACDLAKGGNWHDGPFATKAAVRHALPANQASCRVGFRLVISYVEKSNQESNLEK